MFKSMKTSPLTNWRHRDRVCADRLAHRRLHYHRGQTVGKVSTVFNEVAHSNKIPPKLRVGATRRRKFDPSGRSRAGLPRLTRRTNGFNLLHLSALPSFRLSWRFQRRWIY